MREFFKSELESLKAKTGLNQYENLSAMPDAIKQFKILFDSLEMVRAEFHYIPDDAVKQIVQESIIRDQDFTSLNSRVLYRWLNAKKDYYWALYQSQVEQQAQATPVPFDQLPPDLQAKIEDFKRSLLEGSGLQPVPKVSEAEMDAISKSDARRTDKPKSLVAGNPRPKFIVGRTCDQCGGTGHAGPSPEEQFGCTHCDGAGELDQVEIQATDLAEARKVYNQTFGI